MGRKGGRQAGRQLRMEEKGKKGRVGGGGRGGRVGGGIVDFNEELGVCGASYPSLCSE